MKTKDEELKSLDFEALSQKASIERVTLQKLKFSHAISPIENPSRIRASRKTIARILTEMKAREIANAKKD